MPGLDPTGISAIAGGIGGLLSTGIGLLQRGSANRQIKKLGESPKEQIPSEVLENQQQARLNANVGLPSAQYAQAMKNIQRQQMMALGSANDRRGGLLALSGINDQANNSIGRLDANNAQARLQNQNTLYGINNNVSGWKDKVWRNNVKDVWDRKFQYAQSLLASGNQNIVGGIDQLTGGAATYFGGRSGNNRQTNAAQDAAYSGGSSHN